MKRSFTSKRLARLAPALFAICGAAPAALRAQVTITGNVANGTTLKPAAQLPLELLSPRGGMQVVAETKTDSGGNFTFNGNSISPSGFYLVQATYQGVDYHAPVQFDSGGKANINITVYSATHTPPALRVPKARVLVQAEGQKVHVQEMFAIENSSQPPESYVNPSGTFHFHVSPSAGKPSAAAVGLMNMTLPQEVTSGKDPGDYSIEYALKPGVNVVMIVYDSDYLSGQFTLDDRIAYPIDHLELFAQPSTLTVNSKLFQPAGGDEQTGAEKYVAENLKPGASFGATLSGEAAAASDTEQAGEQPQVAIVPSSVTKLKIPLLLCFLLVLLWALGIRTAKEWPQWKAEREGSPARKQFQGKLDSLLNSIADLDDVYAAGKIPEKKYWKERLELKAKVVAILKKGPKAESHAARIAAR